jgi:hypothetical protein
MKFIFLCSGGWGSKHWQIWRPVSWFINNCLLAGFSHGGKGKTALWRLFYKGTKCIYEVSASWLNHLPKVPHLTTIIVGVRVSI